MHEEIVQRIHAVFQSLAESGILPLPEGLSEDTVLIGDGAALDSIAFVNFFFGLEQELAELTGQEVVLSLEEIQAQGGMDRLDVRGLAGYIGKRYFGPADA